MSQQSSVEVVLDPHTLTIYQCQSKEKKVHGLTGREGPVLTTTAEVYCSIRNDLLVVGVRVLDTKADKTRLWESFLTRNLRLAFQTVLMLDSVPEIRPITPSDVLARLNTNGGSGNQKALEELLGQADLLKGIRTVCPLDVERVLDFTKKHGASTIFDPSQVRYPNFSREQLQALAAVANRSKSTQEVLLRLNEDGIESFTVDQTADRSSDTMETESV